MSAVSYYHDLAQRHAEITALHAQNVCSYLRGRLNARVVERLAPAEGAGTGLARYRLVFRGRGADGSAGASSGTDGVPREWTGTLPEICREFVGAL